MKYKLNTALFLVVKHVSMEIWSERKEIYVLDVFLVSSLNYLMVHLIVVSKVINHQCAAEGY